MLDARLEDVPSQGPAPMNALHRQCDDLSTDHGWHFHPQYELTLFIRSSGVRFVGDSVGRYGPGDLILSGPNLPHCWRNMQGGESAEWLTVQFDPIALAGGLLELPEASAIRDLFAEARRGLAFDDSVVSDAQTMMRSIAKSNGLRQILKLLELLTILAEGRRTHLATAQYHQANRVDQSLVRRLQIVTDYVNSHFRGSTDQAALARSLGMTPVALSKFVRAATGRTFSEMVKVARINEACRLLAYSKDTITNVALDCGYQHTSHFDRQFMELKGMTPSEYRRAMTNLALGSPTGK